MKKHLLLFFTLLFYLNLVHSQEKINLVSEENLFITDSNQGITKNWYTTSLAISKHGSIFILHGASMEVPISKKIDECYKLDNNYYAFEIEVNNNQVVYVFSFVHDKSLLLVNPETDFSNKIELHRQDIKPVSKEDIDIGGLLPLLKMFIL